MRCCPSSPRVDSGRDYQDACSTVSATRHVSVLLRRARFLERRGDDGEFRTFRVTFTADVRSTRAHSFARAAFWRRLLVSIAREPATTGLLFGSGVLNRFVSFSHVSSARSSASEVT